jgi:formylglycine-generating enzyme required for sulfatase activity
MGSNPSRFKADELPVELVSWEDVQAFIAKLNLSAALPAGWKYALPTEAQWEYACRAGTNTAFAFGDSLSGREANFNVSGDVQYSGFGKAVIVGSYKPNAWGLNDMHGNLYEWCADGYGDWLTGGTDPVSLSDDHGRVNRGGSWFCDAGKCRSAIRFWNMPGQRIVNIGFRVAAVPAGAR